MPAAAAQSYSAISVSAVESTLDDLVARSDDIVARSIDALKSLQQSAAEIVGSTLTSIALGSGWIAQAMTRPANAQRSTEEEWQEERLSAITHCLGLVVSVAAVAYLLAFVGTLGYSLPLATCGVYGLSLVMMYAASTALHAARNSVLKRRFQLYDHIAIYLLIAGTYTPFLVLALKGSLGLSMLACVWILAAIGVANKLKHADRLAETSPIPCLLLGWCVLLVIKPLTAALPAGGIVLLIAGGVSYSIGMIFYCRDDKRYFHAIWHLFVMLGSGFHFAAVCLNVAI
jgi:hemolysin III